MAGTGKMHATRMLLSSITMVVLAALSIFAAEKDAMASKRVALVIGNSAYENAAELANTTNDASDIAVALRDLGFEVVLGLDLKNRAMRDKVREFGQILRGADVAMLFYAGHAMQVNGQNYLAPVDTRLEYESDLDFETIPLQFIQRQMEREAKVQLLFLDACRDNPLTRSLANSSRSSGAGTGLAEEELDTTGILIAFATNPGNVALDGRGRNSPFTRALLDNIRRPGIEISTLMTDVRVQVREATNNQQTPWINSALLGRFYFNPAGTGDSEPSAEDGTAKVASLDEKSGSARTGSSAGVENARIEALAWEAVQGSENIEELETFLSTYGAGFYGKLAKIRIERLKAKQGAAEATSESKPAEPEETARLDQPEAEDATPAAAEPEFDPGELAKAVQEELARLNCNPGHPDGIWGPRSAGALKTFARVSDEDPVANEPTPALLEQLRDYEGKNCPKVVRKATPKRQASAPPQTATRSVGQQNQQQGGIVQDPQQQGVIIQQPQQAPPPGVIVQPQPAPPPGAIVQPQPAPGVIVQPQPRNPLGELIGRTIIGGAITCVMAGC